MSFGLVVVIGVGAVSTAVSSASAGAGEGRLNVDAIPADARHLASWVVRAGAMCPELNAPMVAAQLDLESSWNPAVVAHNPADRGGDAVGIAQFQTGTWATWGGDYDEDGRNEPADPEDAIVALGRLMCDNIAWAQRGVGSGQLSGDVLDLAWAAYFCGRRCVSDAGGATAFDYPQQVRSRTGRYTLVASVGAWQFPLPAGSYELVSRFRTASRPSHDGVDLAAPAGTPIYAVAGGVVLDAGCTSAYCDRPGNPELGGCGLRVNLNHGGLATRYCHAVRLNVTAGALVQAGDVLGWVGSTGNSSGPHLHFEVHLHAPPMSSATAVDPAPYLGL
ncbi:M23 family metallopeptidase [Virgisporangium ochraceum]|uniref:Peptidase n=2 Tax=Virgisporangium ochraceum TaxID=65505 RepID=A0A8J3ZPS8_9ACTN|nr:peptidase [Virgisporangium ochraceum]